MRRYAGYYLRKLFRLYEGNPRSIRKILSNKRDVLSLFGLLGQRDTLTVDRSTCPLSQSPYLGKG